MKAKKTSLHLLLILFAVALVSVLFVVSCGRGATATAVPGSPTKPQIRRGRCCRSRRCCRGRRRSHRARRRTGLGTEVRWLTDDSDE